MVAVRNGDEDVPRVADEAGVELIERLPPTLSPSQRRPSTVMLAFRTLMKSESTVEPPDSANKGEAFRKKREKSTIILGEGDMGEGLLHANQGPVA